MLINFLGLNVYQFLSAYAKDNSTKFNEVTALNFNASDQISKIIYDQIENN